MGQRWDAGDIPPQTGRVAVVTGATSGLGFETARQLAAHGATVVVTGRDAARAGDAVERLSRDAPAGRLVPVVLELGSLESVREAGARLKELFPRIDLLINNAGVTGLAEPTRDGFEPQMGVNHLGHFALTGHLLPHLAPVPGSRIVAISSVGHRMATLTEGNFQEAKRAYERSKLANLVFARELDRRLRLAEARTRAVAAHPGGAVTGIFRYSSAAFRSLSLAIAKALGGTPEMGALPTLRAATDVSVDGGDYLGPSGLLGMRGHPDRASSSRASRDPGLGTLLWTRSELLTGVSYL
ncbi:SDR family NAD(P)-dependent oxidoreductase [Actinocorallia aurea]